MARLRPAGAAVSTPEEEDLRQRIEELQILWNAMPAMVWFKDREGRILRANRAAAQSIGISAEDLEGRSSFEVYPEDAARYAEDDQEVIRTGEPKLGIVELLPTASGERRWVRTDKVPFRDRAGNIIGVVAFAVDITERFRAEMLLASQNQVMQWIAAGTPLADTLEFLTLTIQEQVSGMLCSLLLLDEARARLSAGPAPDLPPGLLRAIDDLPAEEWAGPWGAAAARRERVVVEDVRTDPLWAGYRDLAAREGVRACWMEPVLSEGGRVLGVFALYYAEPRLPAQPEIQLIESAARLTALAIEAARTRDRLIHNALHDPLTGLPNRTLFLDRLQMTMERAGRPESARSFAVLFIDLDRFKLVNDSLGHLLGDELLQAITARLKRCLRRGDTLARFGGDEFALLLEDLEGEEKAIEMARGILESLEVPFRIGGEEVFSSASVGIALSAAAYGGPEELLRDADTAMYRAKAQGRSGYAVFHPSMHQRAVSQLKIESALRRAVDRGELRLHYQPIVELTGGRIRGFEALVRWEHPELGLLRPDSFLGVAEEIGIIPRLGEWVLAEACRQLREWQGISPAAGTLKINVNLHALQLSGTLVRSIERTLWDTGLAAESLNLELTEHAMMREAEGAIATLKRIREMGAGVCLDDFGTGYSSLSYLVRFPVTTLKIDRSFVGSIRRPGESVAIVETIRSLARTLNLEVVAEGLETAPQLAALRALDCDCAQGYLFSPPVPPDLAAALVGVLPPWLEAHFSPVPPAPPAPVEGSGA
jgi:diguanylate cyclase (GGDEF)-like protein/PAS domain S-box-containing protein